MISLQRLTGGLALQLFRRATYSSSSGTVRAGLAVSANTGPEGNEEEEPTKEVSKKTRGSLVAAAFENLKAPDTARHEQSKSRTNSDEKNASIDERIINAKTVHGLLAIAEVNGAISRKHALKIVSILSDWTTMNRINLDEFENDSRFLKICRMLGRTTPAKNSNQNNRSPNNGNGNDNRPISGFRTDDLNTVLGVAGDDEAAKLIASISLPQMVKVMSTLALRKRRSTPLLRSLAFNISSSTDQLDLKQCADVFFAMSMLNFQDSVLAAKICADIQAGLAKNLDKSAVVGSILTSLGILKYRDLDILEALTDWTLKHSEVCRPQDLSALFITSAILNFKSTNINEVRKKLVSCVVREDFRKPNEWLNHIWALAMSDLVEHPHLKTVLSAEFVSELESSKTGLSLTSKMKLLNLNSYAQLIANNYEGPLLPANSSVFDVALTNAKTKQVLLNGVLDALKSLLPASNHVRCLVDTRMGFLIDAFCQFDSKCNPLPLDKEHKNAIKVALMIVDFHDVCHGTHRAASGITTLSFNLLEKSGYTIIPVPYNEFNTSDKLLKRVQYLEGKLKAIISSSAKD